MSGEANLERLLFEARTDRAFAMRAKEKAEAERDAAVREREAMRAVCEAAEAWYKGIAWQQRADLVPLPDSLRAIGTALRALRALTAPTTEATK